ncbi:MAG TPA: cupin domain-containing protein [Chloroflexota bacterium]|nr:cupin domain-containing protein [Chloroflexota bacterium]
MSSVPPYQVERRAVYVERPNLRLQELQIRPDQSIPWHLHRRAQDIVYVVEGEVRIFLRDPDEEVRLGPGQTYTVRAGRPHHVTNAGTESATFLNIQGPDTYDFVPIP